MDYLQDRAAERWSEYGEFVCLYPERECWMVFCAIINGRAFIVSGPEFQRVNDIHNDATGLVHRDYLSSVSIFLGLLSYRRGSEVSLTVNTAIISP